MQKKNETRRDGIYDSLYREICAEEDAKVMALLEASIIDHERKKKMRVDHNTINLIFAPTMKETFGGSATEVEDDVEEEDEEEE